MTALLGFESERVKYSPISKFPCVNRDLAVIVADDDNVGDLIASIREAGGDELEDVELFDVYKGEQIEKGYKSVAFSLKFRSQDKTMSENEIQKIMTAVMEKLKVDHGARLR